MLCLMGSQPKSKAAPGDQTVSVLWSHCQTAVCSRGCSTSSQPALDPVLSMSRLSVSMQCSACSVKHNAASIVSYLARLLEICTDDVSSPEVQGKCLNAQSARSGLDLQMQKLPAARADSSRGRDYVVHKHICQPLFPELAYIVEASHSRCITLPTGTSTPRQLCDRQPWQRSLAAYVM